MRQNVACDKMSQAPAAPELYRSLRSRGTRSLRSLDRGTRPVYKFELSCDFNLLV